MEEMYSVLAPYYDRLMTGVDYDGWADYICGIFERLGGGKVRRVLDIGCGTGEMTLRLAQRGYELTGTDLSPEMLTIAEAKARSTGADITFALQDMRATRMANKVDAVICCLDGMNYMPTERDILLCLGSARKALNEGGILVFDVNSPYKFENIYADRDYILEEEGVLCAWHNDYDPVSRTCCFDLSIFTEIENGSYSRCDELQYEHCYTEKELKSLLLRAGFILDAFCGDLTGRSITDTDERWYISARLPE